MTSPVKFRKSSKALGVQEAFWDIAMRVGKLRVPQASQEDKRNAQSWLFRAAGPVEAIKNGGDKGGEKSHYAMALFRLERAGDLLRLIGCRRVTHQLDGFVLRLKKLREARWGAA